MSRKRRGNGEGSIFQRQSDGRWVAKVTVGCNANGRPVYRREYADTKREAMEKLTRLQTRRLDGTLGEPSKLTVAKYLTSWLENSARPAIRYATYQLYEGIVRLHVLPNIGGVPLAKLTLMCERFQRASA